MSKQKKWRHGGNIKGFAAQYGLDSEKVIDFSASINPFGPPEWLRMVISSSISDLVNYPDPHCLTLKEKIAAKHGVGAQNICLGNGSSELLFHLPMAVNAKKALIPVPSYVDYQAACESAGLKLATVEIGISGNLDLDFGSLNEAISSLACENLLVIIGNPNNPTGRTVSSEELKRTALKFPEVFFLVDEAFGDFVPDFKSLSFERLQNVAVLKSFTKMFSVPGIRTGYLVADAAIVDALEKILPPWRIGGINIRVAEAAIDDEVFTRTSADRIAALRKDLIQRLTEFRCFSVVEGAANYLLVKIVSDFKSAYKLEAQLANFGICIRVCDNFQGLGGNWFRIAVKGKEDNDYLIEALKRIVKNVPASRKNKRTPALMIQGTSSNAGKSLITAAICRIMFQDGLIVAPFKAQNMSLNSYVTRDGFEMANAQALQARACGLDPEVRMNPVLVKPSSDIAGQIILNGRPVGKINASSYFDFRKDALPAIRAGYDSLASEFDAVLIEGAGSPAEVNLKKNDLVNMNMALYAKAPVMIVGDIDRGGVFASFIGCMETFTEEERKLVAGFLVNKFRGESGLLHDAFDYVRKYTGKDTLGVVPFIKKLRLPEEDSVNLGDMTWNHGKKNDGSRIEICVINLPHFSNFTDFDALDLEVDVFLNLVSEPKDILNPDCIIIPGSKNVISDLDFMNRSGIAGRIKYLASEKRCPVLGICGGYQMLGISVEDPHQIESSRRSAEGLGLLDVRTVLQKEKKLKRVNGMHIFSGKRVEGYEIHHGATVSFENMALIEPIGIGDPGSVGRNGQVSGVYMHGLFDSDGFRRWFINDLRMKKGLKPVENLLQFKESLDNELDRLADVVRSSLDMTKIYRMMGI